MKLNGFNLNYAKVNFGSERIEYPILEKTPEGPTGITMRIRDDEYTVIGFSFGYSIYREPIISAMVCTKPQPASGYVDGAFESVQSEIGLNEPDIKLYGFFEEELDKKEIADRLLKKSLRIMED